MTARPVFLKLAAFFFAFAAALALVRVFRPAWAWPAAGGVSCGIAPPPFNLPEDLGVEVGLVTLDRENSRSHVRLKLWHHRPAALSPEKLWVRTFFFTPDDRAGYVWASDEVEISRPFGDQGYVDLTVTAPCSWCDDADAPLGGYFARVQISDGSEETPLPQGAEFADIKTAIPVVVHAERVPPRR